MRRFVLMGLVVAGWAAAGLFPASAAALANGLVAIVNDEAITLEDVEQEAALTIESKERVLGNRPAQLEKEKQKARQEALEHLINRKLILHEFKRTRNPLPESLIDDQVRARLKERWGGDRMAMTRDLHANGMTVERLRERERDRLIVTLMRSWHIAREIVISPFRIEKYYAENIDKYKVGDQIKLRTIMVNKPARESPEGARKRADEVVTKLNQGASFAEMAAIYSEDSFRNQGGDRGWIELEREHYHPELEKAIRALKVGERSGVVEAGNAFWILLLEGSKLQETRTLPEVRVEIEEALIAQERARLEKQWIERLKARSFIQTF